MTSKEYIMLLVRFFFNACHLTGQGIYTTEIKWLQMLQQLREVLSITKKLTQ